MNPETEQPRSPAAKASWAALGLAVGCGCVLLLFEMLDGVAPFAHTRHGILTGSLPRTLLYVLWAGEALAVVAGVGSWFLIRRPDFNSKAIAGIVARSLCGVVVGLFGTLVLWLYVGHRVIGF